MRDRDIKVTKSGSAIQLFQMDRKLSKHRILIDEAIEHVLNSSSFILGEHLLEFEQNFAKFIGVKGAVGVANGTDAIELAILSLNLPPNSKIATVANASNYSTTAIRATKFTPIYMDINPRTQLTDLFNVQLAIDLGADAVILTHLYGSVIVEIDQIIDYCKARNVPVIEDCAQAHGATIRNRKAGSFGDASTFSFYPTKNLGALGDAGLVASNDTEIITRLEKLRNYGWGDKYKIDNLGGRNSRMDEIQAAILNKLLPHLTSENQLRERYAHRIRGEVKNRYLEFLDESGNSNWHLMVVLTLHRAELSQYLESRGIQTGIHYPLLDSDQIGCQSYQRCNNLKNSYSTTKKILTLPMSPFLTDTEVTYLIQSLNDFHPSI